MGKCDFNLPSYIGKEPKYETLTVVGEDHEPMEEEQHVFKGDTVKFPDAQLTFRISCSKAAPKISGASSSASRSVIGRVTKPKSAAAIEPAPAVTTSASEAVEASSSSETTTEVNFAAI